MKKRSFIAFVCGLVVFSIAACVPLTPGAEGSAAPAAAVSLPTPTPAASTPATAETAVPLPSPIVTDTPTPAQPAPSEPQRIAFTRDGNLVIAAVTEGAQSVLTQIPIEGGQAIHLAWSPSGQNLAFTSSVGDEPHLFSVSASGESAPTDLGPGSAPAWSPDGQYLAYIGGTFPDDYLWMTPFDHPEPRQLTFETNHAWGAPAFTPDGAALIVAGANRDTMGATGNVTFSLEYLSLDGSGTRRPIPGTGFSGKLPYDLRFSPDGSRFAFSAYYHLSACVSPGVYSVISIDGSHRQDLISPSLQSAITDPSSQYFSGQSYAWSPDGKALVVFGSVISIDMASSNPCQMIAGPQMSVVGLDASERTVIPGLFGEMSMDQTGTLIAASHQNFPPSASPEPSTIDIYSALTGQLILALGPGDHPVFQP